MRPSGTEPRWSGDDQRRPRVTPTKADLLCDEQSANSQLRTNDGGMSGFFGKLADSLVALMYQRDMNSNLANLKAILEAT